jgi:hypothetical protein
MHPDGSYAGEYGSRNTFHFYPHGFEILAPRIPEAAAIADHFTRTLPARKRYYNDDDRMCAHYLYNWLQAYLDFSPAAPPEPISARKPLRKYFPAAKIAVVITPAYHAVANFSKGGVIKVFDSEGALYSDTGLVARDARGACSFRTSLMPKTSSKWRARVGKGARRRAHGTPPRHAADAFQTDHFPPAESGDRRFAPNLLRALLQKKLILGKPRTDGVSRAKSFCR